MNSQETYFLERLKTVPPSAAPGFLLQAYQDGKLVLDVEWGKIWKYYDLASVTKIMFTVPWVMKAVEEGKVDLSKDIGHYLPWYPFKIKVINILNHTSGLDWWQPFYKHFEEGMEREHRKNLLKRMLIHHPPSQKQIKSVYSDINFMLLGFLIEEVYEKEWVVLAEEYFSSMNLEKDIFFQPENKTLYKKNQYAPTEDCSWRKSVMQGQVHDQNTFAMGGVAPQAGLFGTMAGVSQWGLEMRKIWQGKSKILKSSTLKKFAARATTAEQGDWGLGFMIPTPGASTAGQYFSGHSFGHTGFTGTSFWMDPEKDLFVVILSNRIHPTIKNEAFKKWRPLLHDWVVESLCQENT